MDDPDVEVERVEAEANRLLAGVPSFIWDRRSLPIPVEDIVENLLCLQVRIVKDMSAAPGCDHLPYDPQELSGLLLVKRGEIWVKGYDVENWPPRGRFTICHEAGHFMLHHLRTDGSTGGNGDAEPAEIHCRAVHIAEVAGEGAADSDCESDPVAGPDPDAATATGAGPVEKPLIEREADAFAAAMLMPESLVRQHVSRHGWSVDRAKEAFDTSHKAMKRRLNSLRQRGFEA